MGKTAEEKLAAILKALSVADASSMAARMRESGLHGWAECLEQYVKVLDAK